jgi:Flp pilus assembly protein TadD
VSLIIDAIKRAQQLRLQEGKGIPSFLNPHPAQKKRMKGLSKRWMAIAVGLAGVLILSFVYGRPTPPPPSATQASQTLGLHEKEPSIPVNDPKGQELSPAPPPPPQIEKLAILPKPLIEAKEEPLIKPTVGKKQVVKIDPPKTTVEPKSDSLSLPDALKKEETLPFPPSGTLQAKASPKSLAKEEEKEEASRQSWAIRKEEGGKATWASDVLIHFNRGVHFSNQRETIKAIQAYQKVLEIDPTYVEAYNNLGILYQEMGDFEKARKAYQMAVDINPHYEKALNNLGILYYLQGRYEESMGALQRALEVNPNNVESLINLGILFKKRGQLEQAMESFQKALTLNPLQGEIHYNLGLVYEQAKKFQLAIEHYQTFINLSAKTHSVLVREVRRHVNDLWKTAKEKN